jgi:dUTP pyrophosphatase
MQVKIKKVHKDAKLPEYMTDGAGAMDMYAVTRNTLQLAVGPIVEYDTGIALEIPEGHIGLLFPRSSITTKTSLFLGNSVGCIDSDYRGSIKFQFRATSLHGVKPYDPGDRIGQLIIVPFPKVQWNEVNELSDSERGTKGFGSSGT